MSEHLRTEQFGPIAVITVDRPPVNAYNREIRDGIVSAISRFELDPEVRAIVLTATGSVFSGGQDLEDGQFESQVMADHAVSAGFKGLVVQERQSFSL